MFKHMLIKTPFSVFCSYDKHFFHPWFRLVDFAHILAAAMKLCPEEKTEKKQQIKRVKNYIYDENWVTWMASTPSSIINNAQRATR